jgi:hypothetical protein
LVESHLVRLVSVVEASAGFPELPLVLEGVDPEVTLPLPPWQQGKDCTVELQRAGLLQLRMGVSGEACVGVEQGQQTEEVAGSVVARGAWHVVVDFGDVDSSVLQLFLV